VLGVTSHEALSAVVHRDEAERPLLIALDARRGEVYLQTFAADGQPLSEIEARKPAAIAGNLGPGSCRLAGNGASIVVDALDGRAEVEMIEARPIDAAAVAEAAAMRLFAGEEPTEGFALRPLYVRAPDAVPPAPLISPTAASEVPI
jgi:tRNA threonylcarbamoyladenosine biosynthesis protein TsaB